MYGFAGRREQLEVIFFLNVSLTVFDLKKKKKRGLCPFEPVSTIISK